MDVHNYDERLKKAIENVRQCDQISPGNRELMLKFIEYKRAQGTGAGRCAKTLWTIKQFAAGEYGKRGHKSRDFRIMKNFGLLTKDDVQRTFAALEASALKETTKRDFKNPRPVLRRLGLPRGLGKRGSLQPQATRLPSDLQRDPHKGA